jgi:biotin-(acetyl-CoA carboxylase) ligase
VSTSSRETFSQPVRRVSSLDYFGLPTFIRTVEHHPILDSTNTYLKRIFTEGPGIPPGEIPILVIADQQTAGRGREGRSWWTGPGSLAFSVGFDPTQVPSTAGKLLDLRSCCSQFGFAASWAVAATVREMFPGRVIYPWENKITPQPYPERITDRSTGLLMPDTPPAAFGPGESFPILLSIKWPNDVLLNNRKVAGILVEVIRENGVVVGVGVNTNCSIEDAPPELRQRATTLRDLTGQTCDHRHFLAVWMKHFSEVLDRLAEDPTAASQQISSLCGHVGQILTVQCGARTISGICRGISPDGALLLEMDGQVHHLYSAHVQC